MPNALIATPKDSGVVPPNEVVRHRGYYVCLEDCGSFAGCTYLRQVDDWNSEFATTPYLQNATYWPTPEAADKAYKDWMMASKTRLAEIHRAWWQSLQGADAQSNTINS